MRAVFVLTTVALALLLGIVAAASESRVLIGALIVGFAPVMWAVSHGIEWLTGRDIWEFGAPYPYRWMVIEETRRTPPSHSWAPLPSGAENSRRSVNGPVFKVTTTPNNVNVGA